MLQIQHFSIYLQNSQSIILQTTIFHSFNVHSLFGHELDKGSYALSWRHSRTVTSLQAETRPVCVHLTSSTGPLRGASLGFSPLVHCFGHRAKGECCEKGLHGGQHVVPRSLLTPTYCTTYCATVACYIAHVTNGPTRDWTEGSTLKINVLSHSTALTCFHRDGRPTIYYQCYSIN